MAAKYLITKNFFVKYEEVQKFYYVESDNFYDLYVSTKNGEKFKFCEIGKPLNFKGELGFNIEVFLMQITIDIENLEKTHYYLNGLENVFYLKFIVEDLSNTYKNILGQNHD